MSSAPRRHGVLLFAHGARDPRWAAPFEAVAQRMRAAAPTLLVANAYLEFMSPNLSEAGAGLADAGCSTVDVIPLFLGAGGHVRKDLPDAVARLITEHPQVTWRLREAIGELDPVIDAMAAAALRMAGDDEAAAT